MQSTAPLTPRPTDVPARRGPRRRGALLALVATVVAGLVGSAFVYQSVTRHDVTLSLDGTAKELTTDADTVAGVLADAGISLGDHDVVAPAPDTRVGDGSRIAVRFGRPLDVNLDGTTTRHWVTATDVTTALDQIGLRIGGADLSVSRGAQIDRNGMALTVATPKRLTFAVAGRKPVRHTVPALTVAQALRLHGVAVDRDDVVKPRLGRLVEDGDRITVTKVKVVTKLVRDEAVPFGTETISDDSLYEDEEEVVREGRAGSRDVTYRLRFENGRLVARKEVRVTGVVRPVAKQVRVGTKERVAEAMYVGGNTVWDALARCESGGNWAINTGNGYYGGLQFNLGTWQSYGGTGLPSENSRETQIAIAERVRAATGGYGSWPACAASLGLPR